MHPLRLLAATLLLLLAGVCVRLSFWQQHRLHERRARNERLLHVRGLPPREAVALIEGPVPDSLDGLRVAARGRYDNSRTVVLHHRYRDGAPGVEVLTPLVLPGDSEAVLVDRGWLGADDGLRADWRACVERGAADVSGLLECLRSTPDAGSPVRVAASGALPAETVWLDADPAALRPLFPYRLAPFAILQLPGRGVPRRPQRVAPEPPGEGPHLGYAVQWVLIALALAGGALYVVATPPRRG